MNLEVLKEELHNVQDAYLHHDDKKKVDVKILDYLSDLVIPILQGPRVLEMGAGDVIWTPKLVKAFPDVTTVDACEELLNSVKEKTKGYNWTPACCLFEEYCPTEKFDSVLATFVMEHVTDPLAVLSDIRKNWLKEDGRLLLTVPHALSLHRRLAVKMGMCPLPSTLGETDIQMGHKHCFTCYEMEALLVKAGFHVASKFGVLTKAVPYNTLKYCTDAQLKGLFDLGMELPIEYSSIIVFGATR